jgi:hypothetical protein
MTSDFEDGKLDLRAQAMTRKTQVIGMRRRRREYLDLSREELEMAVVFASFCPSGLDDEEELRGGFLGRSEVVSLRSEEFPKERRR